MQAQDIIQFWFSELSSKQRFAKDPELDAAMRERFGPTLQAAISGDLASWRTSATGRLAEIVVLDQFSRNMFRGLPQSFAQDHLALSLAQELVANREDLQLTAGQQSFAYMPYMHSESARVNTQALELFTQLGNERNLDFEMRHKAILDRFGRYPHRNAILGRSSTAEELAFLSGPGSSF